MNDTTSSAGAEPDTETGPAATVGSARSILLTLLGELVYPSRDPVWTSTLLQAFGAMGVAEKSARQALARATAAGWIESDRDGRRASWRITDSAMQLIAEGSRRVRGIRNAAAWNGRWLVLHISLPETRRADRLRLYRSLAWLGFGSPTPGVWICPHIDRVDAARQKIQALDLTSNTMAFEATSLGFGIAESELISQAWDLDAIASHYRMLLQRFGAMRPRSGAAVFSAHIELVNAMQRLPSVDPGLPAALLPAEWNGVKVAARLDELRTRWRDTAHAHWSGLMQAG